MRTTILACVLLYLCNPQYQLGKADVLFIARSLDYPHPLWMNLDATITEIEKHDRWSVLAVAEKKGKQGAGTAGRFFACVCAALARERGFRYVVTSSPPVSDGRTDKDYVLLVAFLNDQHEDIPEVVGDRYSKYPSSREEIVEVDTFFKFFGCPTFGHDRI